MIVGATNLSLYTLVDSSLGGLGLDCVHIDVDGTTAVACRDAVVVCAPLPTGMHGDIPQTQDLPARGVDIRPQFAAQLIGSMSKERAMRFAAVDLFNEGAATFALYQRQTIVRLTTQVVTTPFPQWRKSLRTLWGGPLFPAPRALLLPTLAKVLRVIEGVVGRGSYPVIVETRQGATVLRARAAVSGQEVIAALMPLDGVDMKREKWTRLALGILKKRGRR